MLVLVINLDRAPERLTHMRGEFERIGADFTRLAATDGRLLETTDSVNALEGRLLSKGEIACFMSHRRCWQQLVESGESHAVVLEDDVFLGQGAEWFLISADWFPGSAGLVKLETYMSPTTITARPVAEFDGRGVHRLSGKHLGTGGYALDRETARTLLDLSADIDRQVDDFLFDPDGEAFRAARVHQLVPAICIQGLKLKGQLTLTNDPSTYASGIYEERLTTRTRLSPAGKVKREFVSALRKARLALIGGARNVFGAVRWGRIPFR
ncbi:glycosyl transferase [Aliihoeflea aestuarii]|jgi:glycosyl transferase, family 25|uniref:glycosyltransferase family 25 protein n=1 Tax=Aliihoeflea aestuarii TaxID=453840 RepID=UPI0020950F89|nr:glycosyltransferase family 25 protein [Aliihoeflea aestuarii]MCO6393064.1 glycosyl transferase [Aliihoeflea aestuarii]